jgi:hypothetical protein
VDGVDSTDGDTSGCVDADGSEQWWVKKAETAVFADEGGRLWHRAAMKHGGYTVYKCDENHLVFREFDWWYYTYMGRSQGRFTKVCRAYRVGRIGAHDDMPPLGGRRVWSTLAGDDQVPERVEMLTSIAFSALDPPTSDVKVEGELCAVCCVLCASLCACRCTDLPADSYTVSAHNMQEHKRSRQ